MMLQEAAKSLSKWRTSGEVVPNCQRQSCWPWPSIDGGVGWKDGSGIDDFYLMVARLW